MTPPGQFHRKRSNLGEYLMVKRKSIGKKLRFEIFKRDGFTCQYCGSHPPQVVLHIDHINPVVEGGDNSQDNLITSCESCNLGKGARLLSDVPQSLKDKANEVKEREEQIKGYNAIMEEKSSRINNEAWIIAATIEGEVWIEKYGSMDLLSIKKFLEKLSFHEVKEAAELAHAKIRYSSNKRFKYFCGICWSKIRENNNG